MREFKLIFDSEYNDVLAKCEPHFENLKKIVETYNCLPEGSCYYSHMSFSVDKGKDNLRKNLISLAKESKNILEIGFNMGHSAILMLTANPDCVIECHDACVNIYTEKCMHYVSQQFPGRIKIVKGNSVSTLRQYNRQAPDLVHMDGSKVPEIQYLDFIAVSQICRENHTVIVFNDVWIDNVRRITSYQESCRAVKKMHIHFCTSHDILLFLKKYRLPIALCTLSIGAEYKEAVKYSNKIKKNYCEKNAYDYRDDEDEGIYDKSRPVAWSKINLIQRCLNEGYDYVVWIDADAYIMNPELKLESFIVNFSKGKDILVTMDSVDTLNSGVMFIKNTNWSRRFFKHVYSMTEFINHSNWEQGAIIEMYEKNMLDAQKHVILLPKSLQRLFNSYVPMYKNEDFIMHVAGCWRDNTDMGLKSMMERHCPIRMDSDTDESYNTRIQELKAR
jgi:predicted O-methyltransferase YrrM